MSIIHPERPDPDAGSRIKPSLADFLVSRYTEEEAVAVATRDAHDPLIWNASDYGDTGAWGMGGPVDGPSGYESIVVAPARVLTECEAKRRIVRDHTNSHECPRDDDNCGFWRDDPCDVLRNLGSAYADHPDYRDEWRP